MKRAKYISNGTITYKILGEQGPQGPEGPAGPQGPGGPKGDDGKSAYQIAVDNGYNGTESEWLATLKADIGYVTPQMFGAIGDGSVDDSVPIQRAIDTGKPVIMAGKYKIKTPIKIKSNTTLKILGSLIAQDCNGIEINGTCNNIYIREIMSTTGNGSGICLSMSEPDEGRKICAYNTISNETNHGFSHAYEFYADNLCGIQYTKINLGYSESVDACIYMHYGEGGGGWIAQNTFIGGRLRGKKGVYTYKPQGVSTDTFNKNNFYSVGLEGITDTIIDMTYAVDNSFVNCRCAQLENSATKHVSLTDCYSNTFDLSEINMSKVSETITSDGDGYKKWYRYNRYESRIILTGTDYHGLQCVYKTGEDSFVEKGIRDEFSKISAYGKNSYKPMCSNGTMFEVGGDSNQNLTITLSDLFLRFAKYFYVKCSYKNSTCTINFVDGSGNTIISNDQIISGSEFIAVKCGQSWKMVTIQ